MDVKRVTLDKVINAANAYDSMNDLQRETILPYAERIFDIQRQISKAAKKVKAGEVCNECGGLCCTQGVEVDIDVEEFLYLMFAITQKQREKIYSVIMAPNKDIDCSFVGEKGCVLPDFARPIHCKVFHCMMIPESEEIMKKFGGLMIESEALFRLMIDLMEVEC